MAQKTANPIRGIFGDRRQAIRNDARGPAAIAVHKVRLQRWADRGLDPHETVIGEMAVAYVAGGWIPPTPTVTEPEC